MAAVQQRILNWLYSVLMTEYRDVNRTYNDVAQALSHYSSLAPRTDVYTYENGASALLLHLSGTIPVTFRGTTYRFPIALWVPHGYPQEAPLVYVTPTEGMMVRAGQHVDPQGKVYHPYLVGWAEFWDKSNILDFLAILREIFAKEPPVISRQQQSAPRPTPPPVPPLPPSIARPQSISSPPPINQPQPPPPPPKPGSNQQTYQPGGPVLRESGPPLPPLPGQDRNKYGPPIPQPLNGHPNQPQRSSSLRYEGAPPLPQPARQQSLRDSAYSPSPVSPMTPDQWPLRMQQQGPQYYQQQPYPGQQPQPQPQYQQGPYQQYSQQQQQQQPPPQSKPPPPPVDLLDAPLVLSIPTATSNNLPAPPIPPNPEHNLLLAKVGTSLFQQRTHTRTQTNSSLPGLQAQHKAMLTALNTMTTELQALESLQSTLNNNTQILHSALHDADKVIENSAHRAPPGIDEILVAPTVVGNQLYELVSEERSLADALFVLGRAVEKGRISPAVFAKMTRSLAREWYLKKALVRKIGRGMGLATTTSY